MLRLTFILIGALVVAMKFLGEGGAEATTQRAPVETIMPPAVVSVAPIAPETPGIVALPVHRATTRPDPVQLLRIGALDAPGG